MGGDVKCARSRRLGENARACWFAKTAPKLYDGGALWDASEKECVTWKAGSIERPFIRSARAPSKKKFVR